MCVILFTYFSLIELTEYSSYQGKIRLQLLMNEMHRYFELTKKATYHQTWTFFIGSVKC